MSVPNNVPISETFNIGDFVEHFADKILSKNGNMLAHMKYPTDYHCLIAVRCTPLALEHVENQTDDICMVAIAGNPHAFEYVMRQTAEICLEAVLKEINLLPFVRHEFLEICVKAAIQQDCHFLQRVSEQSLEMCVAAVMQDCRAMDDVSPRLKDAVIAILNEKQHYYPNICTLAIQCKNHCLLQDMYKKSAEICVPSAEQKIA